MKVTLVDNLVFPVGGRLTDFDVHPNLGLASLASVMQLAGHDVRIVDPKREVRDQRLGLTGDLYADAADALIADRPDAIGFTTLGCSFIFTARVAARIKEVAPELPILLGGPHATVLDRLIMESFDTFDVIVRHEAEETINPVLDALATRSFADLPGVTYRTGRTALSVRANPGAPKIKDLDSLPFPAYEMYPIDRLALPYLRIEAGRGCPWACTFCSTATFFQRSYRLKSAGRLVADLDALHERYGYTDFKLEHDLFTVNKRKVAEFCHAVADRDYTWMASARLDCVDDALLELMADAGCRELYFGVETGSVRLQKTLQKRLDLDLLDPVVRKAGQVGIAAVTSFITGFPDETESDRDDTLDVIGSLATGYDPPPAVQLHLLLPEPGTGEFEMHSNELLSDGYVAEFNAALHGDDLELVTAHREIFATYHYYPGRIAREEQIAAVEIVRALLSLGVLVLRQLLGTAETGLAELIGDIRRRRPADRFTVDDLAAYAAQRWGHQHHVTSLIRLRVELSSAPSEPAPIADRGPVDDGAVDDGPALVLSPDAVLFESLHDCGAILTQLANRPTDPLSAELSHGRRDYLAIRSDAGVRLFELDPATHLVASAFAAPATVEQVSRYVTEVLDRPVVIDSIVEGLVSTQALVPPSTARGPVPVEARR